LARKTPVLKWRASAAWLALLLLAAPISAAAQDRAELSSAWAAPQTTGVESSELTFSNGAAELSGTLYAPRRTGKAPAVVVFHGASEPTRDLPLYRHLIQMLPPLGVAVLVYDRRGSGKSTGGPPHGDYDALADDGVAGLRALAHNPRIDPKRIGFWGLSQGGWLSLLAASRCPEAAFAIAVSAPMTTPDVQMNFAVANILRIKGYSQADIDQAVAARTAVDAFERGTLDRATAQKTLDAAIAKPWFDLIYMDKTFADPDKSGWAKEIRHDPMATLPQVKAPALVIYGAKDPWVPVKLSVDRLRASATQYPNITTVVVAGADHEMMLSASPEAQIDPAGMTGLAPDSPEYFGLLASWLTAQGIARVERR
jgi:pimeloyl-ACP methyl ester carboxylesterase